MASPPGDGNTALKRAMAQPTPDKPARKRTDRYHHGSLRQALIRATVRTIEREGVDAVTLRSVGASLGVSRSALYRHFADKDDLLASVAAQGFETLQDSLTGAWTGAGGGLGGFRAMGQAYVDFALTHPAHYRVMFTAPLAAPPEHEVRERGRLAFVVLADAIAQLQHDGHTKGRDATATAVFVWSTVHGLAELLIAGRLGSSDERQAMVAEVLEGVVRGL
jgi:AcrR family transcriptional regulator